MMDSMSYFSFQPVLYDWRNKGDGMCYPVCEMVLIEESLLPIGTSSLCSISSGFPFSLSEWSFTICPTPYNRKLNLLNASLNKTFLPSFFTSVFYTISFTTYSDCTFLKRPCNWNRIGQGHLCRFPKGHKDMNLNSPRSIIISDVRTVTFCTCSHNI